RADPRVLGRPHPGGPPLLRGARDRPGVRARTAASRRWRGAPRSPGSGHLSRQGRLVGGAHELDARRQRTLCGCRRALPDPERRFDHLPDPRAVRVEHLQGLQRGAVVGSGHSRSRALCRRDDKPELRAPRPIHRAGHGSRDPSWHRHFHAAAVSQHIDHKSDRRRLEGGRSRPPLYFSLRRASSAATFSVQRGPESVYAVVRSGARSYRVEEGGTITVDRRAGDAGETVILDQVLVFADGVRVRAGTPFVTDAIVTAQIVSHGRGPKIRVFKYKNKTRSRKTRGHRQDETTLRITKIEA